MDLNRVDHTFHGKLLRILGRYIRSSCWSPDCCDTSSRNQEVQGLALLYDVDRLFVRDHGKVISITLEYLVSNPESSSKCRPIYDNVNDVDPVVHVSWAVTVVLVDPSSHTKPTFE